MNTIYKQYLIPILIFGICFMVLGSSLQAKDDKQDKGKTELVSSSSTGASVVAKTEAESAENKVYSVGNFIPKELLGHLHNKIVHIPVGFGLAAALLIILGYQWPKYRSTIPLLLFIAAIFTIPAYFSGQHQSGEFRQNEYRDIVELHQNMGITTAILLWVGAFLSLDSKFEKWMWIYAVILALMITFTGFLGGILATS